LTRFEFAVPLPDGVAVVANTGVDGTSVYRVDPTGQDWELIEVAGLPDSSGVGSVYGVPAHPWVVYFPSQNGAVDQWLLATVDGERFLVDELNDGSEGDYYRAALNGSVVLVANEAGEWMRYDLTDS
jgi:hypothetical protein